MPWANLARMLAAPHTGNDPMAGERGKGERLHKVTGRGGHDNVNFKGLTLQGAHQFSRLVRGDSARDSDRDSHTLIVGHFAKL